jgi:4-amino-4-deoxy-L-arabinose transferase-like glycosyltransferase
VGYPAYLALLKLLFGNTILAARVLNIVITLGLVIASVVVFRPWLGPRERIVFILICAFLPNLVFSANVLLSDYLFALLLWLAVLIYLQRERFPVSLIAVGFLLAVMSYIRPVGLLLPLVFLYSLWREHDLKVYRFSALAGLLVFVATLAPWTVRNYSVFHTLVPVSTNGGYNFLMGNRCGAPGGVNHDFPYGRENSNEAEESAKAVTAGIHEIVRHPGEAFVRLAAKVFELYRRGDSSLSWALKRTENPLPPFLLSFLFCTTNIISYFIVYISILTLVGRFVFKNSPPIPSVVVHIFCCFILVTLVFVGSERYLIPIFPVHLFLFAQFLSTGKVRPQGLTM